MRLLYLSMSSLVIVATFAISLHAGSKKPEVVVLSSETKVANLNYPDLPVLVGSDSFPILSAQSALVVDVDSGTTLYEKNPDSPLLPASTTKIITALVALDVYDLKQVLTVQNGWVEGQKMGLVEGEKITVNDLMYGLLVYSANDAAEVLANNHPEGRGAFIEAMNEKARQYSLEKTSFTNPSGLETENHITTARDLARIAAIAMQKPTFAKIVGTKSKVVTSVDGSVEHNLVNINELLGKVSGVLGVKTGWTENARENLVTYVSRGGKDLVVVLLASQDRFGETEELIDWIYANFEWVEVIPTGQVSFQLLRKIHR